MCVSYLALEAGDLLCELCDPLRVLGVPDPRHHDLLLHPRLEVGVLPLRLAHLLLQAVLALRLRVEAGAQAQQVVALPLQLVRDHLVLKVVGRIKIGFTNSMPTE